MEYTLDALAARLKGRVIGDGSTLIRSLNSLDAVREGELTFAEDEPRLALALQSKASAVLVPAAVTDLHGRSGISVADPKLAFALLLDVFYPTPAPKGVVHPTAIVGSQAKIAGQVDIRAHAVVGERARIGRGSVIEAGAVIGDDVVIGERCLIGPNVVIYRRTLIGDRVAIHGGSVIGGDGFGYVFHQGAYVKVPQVGNVVIEDDVEIGCNSCVDRATIGSTLIQRGTKIDNQVQIAHNNRIGRHVVIAGQTGFAGSVTVGDYCRFGGKIAISDHVEVGDQVEAGMGTIIIRSAPSGQKLFGAPARPARDALRQISALVRLPELLKRVLRIEQRLDVKSDT